MHLLLLRPRIRTLWGRWGRCCFFVSVLVVTGGMDDHGMEGERDDAAAAAGDDGGEAGARE